ncbi:MAG: N-acetylmuramoyl-L-alanine amidase [Sphingomonadaceae bacterium]|nr:N-acetylmuramoyl-L-alanine amidase [Sphingomonadaceae bacterium]
MRRLLILLGLFLVPVAVFGAMVAADRAFGTDGRGFDYIVRVDLPPVEALAALRRIEGPLDATRPLVVIDAGHGGKDPGAISDGVREKDLTLAMARALRDELLRGGGVRVALTRSEDRYLFLGERSAIARQLGADLFISLHADSTEVATGATGATVYTLSAKGSSEVAERMAARENAADSINGVKIVEQSDDVSAILVDLSQRESLERSQLFARLVLREGQGLLPFKEAAPQSAAFAVLKAPDVPSVLFETGYINSPADLSRLRSEAGRLALAQALARAIRVFFARSAQSAGAL